MSDDEEKIFKAYREDPRIPCRYGVKCYQKNTIHHEKYKHLPAKRTKNEKVRKRTILNKKRKKEDSSEISDSSSKQKMLKKDNDITDEDLHDTITTMKCISESNDNSHQVAEEVKNFNHLEHIQNSNNLVTIASLLQDDKINIESDRILSTNAQAIISSLFLTEMPDDFFQFYEFCENISEKNPFDALKSLQLELVGPYDVLRQGILNAKVEDKQAMLRHWRYYYDPPEFQTIIKHNGIDGLHFGYWRDDISEKPVFIAQNKSTVNHIIEPVAENIFGALNIYIGEKVKLVSPFEKTHIAKLHVKLKNFVKERNITLEKQTPNMQVREKKVVARTFHKAGIVVSYNKKTQLGYRSLSVTDSELQKILKQIEHPLSPEHRKSSMSKLEEVIRLATIAADECDFGTVLELGHDLFSSGVPYIETKALNLLSLAYNLLQRQQFLKIVQAHLQNRRKSLDLSVLQF